MRFFFCLVILECWASPVRPDTGTPPPSEDSTVDEKPDLEWVIESRIMKNKDIQLEYKWIDILKAILEDKRQDDISVKNLKWKIAIRESRIRIFRAELRRQIIQELQPDESATHRILLRRKI
jgi:hypothetical protein